MTDTDESDEVAGEDGLRRKALNITSDGTTIWSVIGAVASSVCPMRTSVRVIDGGLG